MLKKIREFFKKISEKGQGTVEYALILGFVAIIAVYMLTGSGLQTSTKQNITNTDEVLDQMATDYNTAKTGGSSGESGGSSGESGGSSGEGGTG